MSHLQVPSKKFKPKSMSTPSDKCEHIDCECSTHTAESSEHVICKWDTSRDQLMSQFSPLASSNLESMSTASCIDTGGIKMTSSLAMPKPSLVAPRPSLATPKPSRADGATGKSGQRKTMGEGIKDLKQLKVVYVHYQHDKS